jgi:hypothetical protein
MSFKHTFAVTYKTDEGTIATTSNDYTADGATGIDDVVPPSTTNKEYDLPVTLANVKSLLIYSDQALTIKTNSSVTPSDTITVKAGIPIVWNTDMINSIPFATNVAKMFITNAGANSANMKVRCATTI